MMKQRKWRVNLESQSLSKQKWLWTKLNSLVLLTAVAIHKQGQTSVPPKQRATVLPKVWPLSVRPNQTNEHKI